MMPMKRYQILYHATRMLEVSACDIKSAETIAKEVAVREKITLFSIRELGEDGMPKEAA